MTCKRFLTLFLLFAFLVLMLFLTVLPVLSLQAKENVRSFGTINYPKASAPKISALWMRIGDLSTDKLDQLQAGNFEFLFPVIGEWQQDHTISYWYSDSAITSFINAAKARNSNSKVFACVIAAAGYQKPVDITTSGNRHLMFDEITKCLNKGFDGFNDDLESYVGTSQHLVDYWNGVANTCHNLGKLATVDAMCYWDYPVEEIYPYLNVDYICPMLYSDKPFGSGGTYGDESDFKGIMNRVLTQSASPILISIIAGDLDTPISEQLGWMDDQIALGGPYPKLAGFSIWWDPIMRSIDWGNWNNWATKGA